MSQIHDCVDPNLMDKGVLPSFVELEEVKVDEEEMKRTKNGSWLVLELEVEVETMMPLVTLRPLTLAWLARKVRSVKRLMSKSWEWEDWESHT
jgi:hypothetical protein